MARAYRDVAIAFVGVAALASGVIGITPLWWPIVILLAICLGSAVVLIDIVVCDRPVEFRTKTGGRTATVMSAIAILSLMVGAFLLGTRVDMTAAGFPYLVANSAGVGEVKSAPREEAGTLSVVSSGDAVEVTCFVDSSGGRWLKLEDGPGWLRDNEVFAQPHTGRGSPPRCPD